MNTKVIRQLNEVNRRFYQKIATNFDESRNHYWPGWYQFKPLLEEIKANCRQVEVLDIGCGNGRWAEFVSEYVPAEQLAYTGIDTNPVFLDITRQKIDAKHISHTVFELDIVEALLKQQFLSSFELGTFSVISVLGLIHHLPSFELRQQLLSECFMLLKPGGTLILAAWQFLEFERFTKKILDQQPLLAQFGIPPEELEPDDYFMTWDRGVSSVRYCHFVSPAELHQLLQPVLEEKRATISHRFRADGRENAANFYLAIKKM